MGIHLSPKVIKEVGKISLVTGIGQIIFTSSIGFIIVYAFGFSLVSAIYIAVSLTFSSTIIIMKLLSDKDALEKLYGKISIGFLLVQDFVAIIILIVISSTLTAAGDPSSTLLMTLAKGFVLIALLAPLSYYLLPKLNNFFAKSQEFLFVFSIAWGLGLAALFHEAGFSIEVGALIAGIILSISPYSHEISSRLKPLRDFFIIFFFLILGSQMIFGEVSHLITAVIVLSAFVLIGNPLIVMTLMGMFKHQKKNGFMAGLTVAQISEFSLILIAMGVSTGQLTQEVLSFVTLIGLVTIAGSTYMIQYSDWIYPKISRFLNIFERKDVKKTGKKELSHDYILFGYNRIGYSILKSFSRISKKHLVVDFDPKVIKELRQRDTNCIYGDVEDIEFLNDLEIKKAKVVVSTVPEKETNMLVVNRFKQLENPPIIITTARQILDAIELYKAGADYVILPHFLGGEYSAKLILEAKANRKIYKAEREKELKELQRRIKLGHEHPEVRRNIKSWFE